MRSCAIAQDSPRKSASATTLVFLRIDFMVSPDLSMFFSGRSYRAALGLYGFGELPSMGRLRSGKPASR